MFHGRPASGTLAPLICASLLLALPAAASARVTAIITDSGELFVAGTELRDEIVIRVSGPNHLLVDDKDKVESLRGCAQSGDVVLCHTGSITHVRIFGYQSADIITIASNVPRPVEVNGGSGDDSIGLFSTTDPNTARVNTAQGGDGNDSITGGPGRDVLHGGPGNDTLSGSNGDDSLNGDVGNDTLRGSFDDDVLDGGEGADALRGDNGIDEARYRFRASGITVNLAAGSASDGDTLQTLENVTGTQHADTLIGDDNPNTLAALNGSDALDGRGGADLLLPGAGLGSFFGGADTDTLSYDDFEAGVIAAIGTSGNGTNAERNQGGSTIGSDVENLVGSDHNDVLTGNDGPNVINGGIGGDTMRGNSGPDPDAADAFNGGPGFDNVSYEPRSQPVAADGDGTADDGATFPQNSPEHDNVGTDVESLTGGAGGDTLGPLTGNALGTESIDDTAITLVAHVLRGQGGDDLLRGTSPQTDVLFGGPGRDILGGLDGNDAIDASGDAIADTVDCGAGLGDFAKLDLVDNQSGCESIAQAAVGRHPTLVIGPGAPRLTSRTLSVTISCPRALPAPCAGRLEVEVRAGTPLATRSYSLAPGKRARARLVLSPSEARRVRSAIRIRLVSHELDPEGRAKTKVRSVKAKRAT